MKRGTYLREEVLYSRKEDRQFGGSQKPFLWLLRGVEPGFKPVSTSRFNP